MANRGSINNNINNSVDSLQDASKEYFKNIPATYPLPPINPTQNIPNYHKSSLETARNFHDDLLNKYGKIDRQLDRATSSELERRKKVVSEISKEIRENEKLNKANQKKLDLQKISGNLTAQDEKRLKNEIADTSVLISKKQDQVRFEKTAIESLRTQSRNRKEHLDTIKESSRELLKHSKIIDDQRKNSLSHHVLSNGSVTKGLKEHGNNKLRSGVKNIIGIGEEGAAVGMGELALGGAALGVGVILEKGIASIFDGIKANIKQSISSSDIYRGTGRSIGSKSFIKQIAYGHITDDIALSPEESLGIGRILRTKAGSLINDYGSALTATASLDRATGSDLGTFASTYGYLARNTTMGTGSVNNSKFAETFAEAIGKGHLAGLQEESLRGLDELVELTRKRNAEGVDASKYLNLIANISSSGKKELMGENAAALIGNIDQAIRSPRGQYGNVLSIETIEKVMKKHGMDVSNPFAVANAQAEGIGLMYNGKQIGTEEIPEYLKTLTDSFKINPTSRKQIEAGKGYYFDWAKSYASSALNVSPDLAGYMMTHQNLFDPNSHSQILKKYGLDVLSTDTRSKPGYFSFLMNLSQGKSGTEKERQDSLKFAADQARKSFENMPLLQGNIDTIMNSKDSTEIKAHNLAVELAKDGVSPEDKLRAGQNAFSHIVTSELGMAVTFLEKIAFMIANSKLLGNSADRNDIINKEREYNLNNLISGKGGKVEDIYRANSDKGSWFTNGESLYDKKFIDESNHNWKLDHLKYKGSFEKYKPLIYKAALAHHIDPSWLASTISAESGFNPQARVWGWNQKLGKIVFDTGLGQQDDAAHPGQNMDRYLDPYTSINQAAKELEAYYNKKGGDEVKASEVYNAGNPKDGYTPGTIAYARNIFKNKGNFTFNDMPPQTTSQQKGTGDSYGSVDVNNTVTLLSANGQTIAKSQSTAAVNMTPTKPKLPTKVSVNTYANASTLIMP